MRLSGKGIQKPSGLGFGDHYVHIKVSAPKELSPKQRALLRAYAELEADTPGTVQGFTYGKDGGKVRFCLFFFSSSRVLGILPAPSPHGPFRGFDAH